MRILAVMTNYPFPPRMGNTIVAYHSMQYLSRRHSIDLICPRPSTDSIPSSAFVERLVLVPHAKLLKSIRKMLYALNVRRLFTIPYSISAFSSQAMGRAVSALIKDGNYDVILLFEMSAIQYCPPSCYGKLIVNIENPQSIESERMTKLPFLPLWRRVIETIWARAAMRYENRVLPQVAKVLMLSAADMHDMGGPRGYHNLGQVSYGVDQQKTADLLDYGERDGTIVLSGNMYHPPNVDGALFFLKDIFPLVLRDRPSATLRIVGADPDARIYAEAKKFGERVIITGRVVDVGEYVRRATVSVCPIRLKIGTQTKVLEALSWGTPVVTTSAGNGGVGGTSGAQLWVEDDPRQFAMRTVELLCGKKWSALSEAGRNFAVENFSWENSARNLESYLLSLGK